MWGTRRWEYRYWIATGACVLSFGCGGTDNNGGPNLIAITTCTESFLACGGDLTGTWQYTSGCVDPGLTTFANQQIAVDYPACSSLFTDVTLSMTGSAALASGTYSQTQTVASVNHVSINSACLAALANGASLSATTCSQYQTGLNRQTGTSATCSYDGANCNCAYSISRQVSETGTYTVNGSTITSTSVDAGVSETTSAEFCVQGNDLTMREVSDTGSIAISHYSKQ